MTLYGFRLLSPKVQLRYVLSEGAYLARRWEGEEQDVNLYYCDDGGRGFPLAYYLVAAAVIWLGSWLSGGRLW